MEAYRNRINNIFEKQVKPPILEEVRNLPETAKEQAVRRIIKERFGVEIVEDKKEQEPKNKALGWIRRKAKYPLLLALGIAGVKYGDDVEKMIYGSNDKDEPKQSASLPEKKAEPRKDTVTIKTVPSPEVVKAPYTAKKTPDSLERGPKLPKGVAKVREFFASKDNNITPGKPYIVLSKETGLLYAFNEKHNLIAKVPALFGRTPGNAKNTVKKAGEGIGTTPEAAYWISNTKDSKNPEQYEIQFSLYGLQDSLGLHDIWQKELTKRSLAIESESVTDNDITNGCINIKKEDFIKFMDLFKADFSELLVVSGEDTDIDKIMINAAEELIKNRLEREKIYKGAMERNKGDQEALNELGKGLSKTVIEREKLEKFVSDKK